MNNSSNNEELAYLFNVDILIKDRSNALALQSLIELLNRGELVDYRVKSGVELGQVIEATLSAKRQAMINKTFKGPETVTSPVVNEPKKAPKVISSSPKFAVKHASESEETNTNNLTQHMSDEAIQSWIQNYIDDNRLVRLSIERNRERMTIPCRILNYASDTRTINVYHVDQKQVYMYTLSEIIDFVDA
ncbi:hypothetical protein J2Z69_003680 [Paenibacillus shirakamiensis]|uniref:Uncharacterized protein n=1 Tax=Paenibacillus shirakamiensis TaxID=1265935 RepID=A0ABS4JLK3_9BACL|nr:hypothetical protein [Paenibacillus shirakamiensis]MBP2002594.1 hypothetical protein [Paenibacillus shirakamiensis]